MEGNREITKKEMMLAIMMSQYYEKTHVLFIPPKTNYTRMLGILRSQKYIEPKGLSNYKFTEKGAKWLLRQNTDRFKKADQEIDNFINSL